MKIAGFTFLGVLTLALLVLAAGQLGFFGGNAPGDLGVREGRLKPPAQTPNSVSSQAGLYPDHPLRLDAQVAPLRYRGDGKAALQKLATLLDATPGAVVVTRAPGYLYAQVTTRWLKFTDDLEFYLDEPAGVIQVRSASRIGRKDFGVNRARVEALRQRFEQMP